MAHPSPSALVTNQGKRVLLRIDGHHFDLSQQELRSLLNLPAGTPGVEQRIELADGTQRNELVFAGSVGFFGDRREVQVMLTDSEDALIGTSLLNHYPLAIEFPGGQVKYRSGPKTKGKRRGT